MDSENHREKKSLAGLMSCMFNAAANTEKMPRTGLEPKKELSEGLVAGLAKTTAGQAVQGPPMSKHLVS